MASIRRTDTLHNKGFSKGRPTKPDRERSRKRQESYRWRDARRIYLANSFDHWRKLRSSLGMKDSVLAWHLMEAHEKAQCGICRQDLDENQIKTVPDDQPFLPKLIKALRNVCLSQLQFKECIKVVGILCLEFDNLRKENFSIDETISSKLQCVDDHCASPLTLTSGNGSSSKCTDVSNNHLKSTCPTNNSCDTVEKESQLLTSHNQKSDHDNMKIKEEREVCPASESDFPFHVPNLIGVESVHKEIPPYVETTSHAKDENIVTHDSFVESEMEVSLEIDVEKIDTSQEMDESCDPDPTPANPVERKSYGEGINSIQKMTSSSFEVSFLPPEDPITAEKPPILSKSASCVEEKSGCHPPVHTGTELPLDMSMEKTESYGQQKEENIHGPKTSTHRNDLCQELSVDTSYSHHKMMKLEEPAYSDKPDAPVKGASLTPPQSLSNHSKEEIHPSIPWQRRDMSRKEEYEFLELNPFCDLSEFSQRYPHVHQRTYYRWKRRIKEEFIILEQCPHMGFEQFSSVVLQAKQSVFNLWKSFIAQGKGFFAPSDASKRLEAKCPTAKSVNTLSEQYSFLQKNLMCTQEQFCQKFYNTSPEVFITLKRKVMQELWVFYHNRHLDWKEFSKLIDISEEVYGIWRDHVSRDTKSFPGGFSPNSGMMPPHYPALSNASDHQAQLLKANSNMPNFDSTSLEDTVSRNLSANYLSSVQNMMFPWASYYAVHSPLNHQMLPMMLWNRMNLKGNPPNPMGLSTLMASSPSSCGSQAGSPHPHEASTSISHTLSQPAVSLPDAKSVKEENLYSHSYSQEADGRDDLNTGVKRISSHVPNGIEYYESGRNKKQRVHEEADNTNCQSPVNKSRKQNKQEYVYYLKNPSLSFKDLETLFPSISLRTFYRWRKEMHAALLYMQENKDPVFQQFKLVFPDIPEDVFEIWRTKSGKENFAERILFTQNMQRQEEYDVPKGLEVKEELDYVDMDDTSHLVNQHVDKSKECSSLGEASPAKKQLRAAHLFIHKNPHVDFTSFSKSFPNISARSFYRWKREWKDAVDLLQSNPGMDYERYKSIDSSINEEIFDVWKQFSTDMPHQTKDCTNSSSTFFAGSISTNDNLETSVKESSVRKLGSQEFVYLQHNPQIHFHEFNNVYPHITHNIFDQWQREISQIIDYMRSQPTVCFEEISAVLPDVTEKAFLNWKEQLSSEKSDVRHNGDLNSGSCELVNTTKNMDSKHEDVTLQQYGPPNAEAKTQITNALLHLMHTPNIDYQVFSLLFPIITPETFQLWQRRIKCFIQQIASNPSLQFEEFRSVCSEIEEDVFRKWKSMTQEEISAIGSEIVENSEDVTKAFLTATYRDRALYFCQENPHISYDLFSTQYYHISETDFKCWMLKISTQISFIRDNQNLSFEDIHGIYPDVDRTIFDLWKKLLSNANAFPHLLKPDFSLDESWANKENGSTTSLDSVRNGQNNSLLLDTNHNGESSKLVSPEDIKPANQFHLIENSNHGNQDQESSLKKLSKLADTNASYYCGWDSRPAVEMLTTSGTDEAYSHLTTANQSSSLSAEFAEKNNVSNDLQFINGYEQHYHQAKSSVAKALQRSDLLSSPTVSEGLYNNNNNNNDTVDGSHDHHNSAPLQQENNQSLSALMVMSADCHKFPSVTSTPKMEKKPDVISQSFTNADKWKYAAAGVKEDDEMFSSQRQKKMSRAEYLFVKDNPDVDSQEFARIFPGVSARTFYRWKKEIKAQMQTS